MHNLRQLVNAAMLDAFANVIAVVIQPQVTVIFAVQDSFGKVART